MDFMTAAKTGFNKLTDFDGKAGRAEFWWYFLATVLVMIVVSIVLAMVLGMLGSVIASLAGIGLIAAVTVRRLRDAGKPEMLAYVYFGLAILLNLLTAFGIVLGIVSTILALATLVVALVLIFFLVQASAES